MRILLVGNGGREHAICLSLSKSPKVEKIFTAPGNPGTEEIPKNENVSISATDIHALTAFASSEGIDLTIVGPEKPLSLGIVDRFLERGLRIFGPTQKAAQLESSKKFSKKLMKEINVPTASFETFSSFLEAKEYLEKAKYPLVIKADGLAAGKGVSICTDLSSALLFAQSIMEKKELSETSSEIVVEEYLEGEEASFFIITDGIDFLPLTSAQDHKRLLDGDKGPNTGGMGAYSPAPCFNSKVQAQVEKEVVIPVLSEMSRRGTPFVGILFVGLILTKKGVKVLEFNVRFGDPEAEVIFPRLKSDPVEMFERAVRGKLKGTEIQWSTDSALTVVLASSNYPGSPLTGYEIEGIDKASQKALIFHSGTSKRDQKLLNSGGRVFAVTALASTLSQAKEKAYQAANLIQFHGKQLRSDIGWRALT